MKSRRLMNTIKPAVMSLLAWMLIWTQLIIVPDPGFAEQSHTDSHPATQIGDWQQDGDPATGEPVGDNPDTGQPGSGHEEVPGDGSGNEGTPGSGSGEGKAPASGDAVIAVEPGNLAAGKNMTASSYNQTYVAGNANDSNQATYWESNNNAFPQWLQVDLDGSYNVNKVILKLPASGWETRSQTLTVQASSNGSTFINLASSAAYTFNPADGNKVTINLTAQSARYVRLLFTANTEWPAGQISEFEVYGQAPTGDTEAPAAPGNLAYTEPASGQIKLTWSASADNVGVSGYDVYADHAVRASVAGNVLTYTDNQPAAATVSYYVKAKDAAGNVSAASNTVTRTGSGSGGTGTNLALNKPITASSNEYIYAASNANDGSLSTYWEGGANSYPHTLTIDLGSNSDISSVVLKLNPDSQWGTRTQTIQVLGHDQNSTTFTNLVSAAQYTFNPALGNTVIIPVAAKVSATCRADPNGAFEAWNRMPSELFGRPVPCSILAYAAGDLFLDAP
ncbi:discoidin domain-containing protein [Paenibacillus sp. FSL W8-0187]|uniref:discoidin domain-containing protein n=1 Tax=Paenibacillus sp. FSL W8-0187 TaxID=2921710 RepID=UPI0030DCF0F9